MYALHALGGSQGMFNAHVYVDDTILPFGLEMMMDLVVLCILSTRASSATIVVVVLASQTAKSLVSINSVALTT